MEHMHACHACVRAHTADEDDGMNVERVGRVTTSMLAGEESGEHAHSLYQDTHGICDVFVEIKAAATKSRKGRVGGRVTASALAGKGRGDYRVHALDQYTAFVTCE